MVKTVLAVFTAAVVGGAVSASAQTPLSAEQVRARQRISTMEAILQRAVSNGTDTVLNQLAAVMSDRPMLSGAPQARGVRLDGYGVIFYVQVPRVMLPIMWPLRQIVNETQNQQTLALVQRLRSEVEVAGLPRDERSRLQFLIRELEAQVQPSRATTAPREGRVSAASVVPVGVPGGGPAVVERTVVEDPEGAYTREVKAALVLAMIENSQALGLGAEEWLTVAARNDEPANPLLPGDTIDNSTWVMRIKGSDLNAFRTGALTLEETKTRVEVREE